MKVGDLVECVWQPKVAGVDKKTQCCLPMKYTIKGQLGIITRIDKRRNFVLFPRFGYTHPLSDSALEVLDEVG